MGFPRQLMMWLFPSNRWEHCVALSLTGLLTACAADVPTDPRSAVQPVPASVVVSPPSVSLADSGDTIQLTAVVTDADSNQLEGMTVSWSVEDNSVAKVSANGLVTAVGHGTTALTVTVGPVSAIVAMAVGQSTSGILIDPSSMTFRELGDTATFSATVLDENGDTVHAAVVAWSSADSSVASVTTNGLVTAIGDGATDITARYDSLSASASVQVDTSMTDREILETLFRATGGENWTDNTNWLTNEALSEWVGVNVDEDGRVSHLALSGKNLMGTIPEEVGGLDRLLSLALSQNELSGRIPSTLGDLTVLAELHLHDNSLHGVLPSELGNMQMLRYLSVYNTDLAGPLPKTFVNLPLEAFYLARTELCVPGGLAAWMDSIQETDDWTRCVPNLLIEPRSLVLDTVGDTATLYATVFDAEGDTVHTAEVAWASTDSTVASVTDAGLVTAMADGTTQVVATSDSLADTTAVRVGAPVTDREILGILYEALGVCAAENRSGYL